MPAYSRTILNLKKEDILAALARERQATSTGGKNPQLVPNSAQAGKPDDRKTREKIARAAHVSWRYVL